MFTITKQNQLNEKNQLASSLSIQNYMTTPLTIDEGTTCEQLIDLFKQNEGVECIVLVDTLNRPITLFMRNTLFLKFSRRYSSALFYEKPVSVLIDQVPLMINISSSAEHVIAAALNRDIQTRYDCVLLVSSEQVLQGVLTMTNIMELASELQTQAKYEQSLLIQKASSYIQHIAEEMQKVEQEIVKQQESFDQMIDSTLRGKTLLEAILDSFNHITDHTKLQHLQISNMKNDSKQLKKIASDVVELSEQSNILALNATIEAAKAKEHGLAFNVVASEVRQLAQKTKGSVFHIQNVIQAMFTIIEQNELTSKASVAVTDRSKHIINETEEVFRAIFTALAQYQKEITTISEQAKCVSQLTRKTTSELALLNNYLN